MRHLLNTLYVLTPELYLTLDGENVVAKRDGAEAGRFPLHGLEQIVCFSYMGASPALMGKCAENRISLSFLSPNGKFLARSTGGVNGAAPSPSVYVVGDTGRKSRGGSQYDSG